MLKIIAFVGFFGVSCTHVDEEQRQLKELEDLAKATSIESFSLANDSDFDSDLYKKGETFRHSRAFEVLKERVRNEVSDSSIGFDLESEVEGL